jgi:glutamate synthase domain-containing protein 3
VKALISQHYEKTASPRAESLLANWPETQLKLVRVIPKERAELETAEELHEAASTPVGSL